jgi:nucleoside-diphosphate-sugar epimerase
MICGESMNIVIRGTDAIVHLSAISNDPIGNEYEKVTIDINETASLDLARRARDLGVRCFVFVGTERSLAGLHGPLGARKIMI